MGYGNNQVELGYQGGTTYKKTVVEEEVSNGQGFEIDEEEEEESYGPR